MTLDSLSALTFDFCFNTFIRYIVDQNCQKFGFSLNALNPTHWFRFADDAAVICGLEHENQILLNHFTRWCNWAGMEIRVDKCIKYGIKKPATSLVQFLPKLTLNNSLVPTVESNRCFKYLGHYYNFSMDNIDNMFTLISTTNDLMIKTDTPPSHPIYTILLYHRFILSKLSCYLTIADLSKTWVVENLTANKCYT